MEGVSRVAWGAESPLELKLKSLGALADDVEVFFQGIKHRVVVAARDIVIRESDAGGQLKVLLAGMACSYKRRKDGDRRIVSFQHPGDFCDLYRYVVTDLKPGIDIQALTDCTVAVIDYRDMDGLLSRPTLATVLWRASMLEAAIYREQLSTTSRGTALERVAHLLCEQLQRRQSVGIRSTRLPFSQVDIANATGLSIVHVNRTIQTLGRLDVLSATRPAIEVVDRRQLAEIAGFDGSYLDVQKLVSKWTVQVIQDRCD